MPPKNAQKKKQQEMLTAEVKKIRKADSENLTCADCPKRVWFLLQQIVKKKKKKKKNITTTSATKHHNERKENRRMKLEIVRIAFDNPFLCDVYYH